MSIQIAVAVNATNGDEFVKNWPRSARQQAAR
jgi:hypothetical protein